MKVVIADDEVYVCSLLKHLIDWNGLGLSLAGEYHNGNDVISHFEKEPVDILICDIEMPGLSGNELIKHVATHYPQCKCMVISGFRVFEYARSAMQYGVTKYLLKPIDGEELNAALKSIVNNELGNKNLSDMMKKQAMRQGLLDVLQTDMKNESIESINKKYQYHFKQGKFAIIKAVFTDIDINSEFLPKLTMLFSESLKQKLSDFCVETEAFRTSAITAHAIINYKEDEAAILSPILDQVLRNALEELGSKTQNKCYLGIGLEVSSIQELKNSWQSAQIACYGRVSTVNKQTYYAKYTHNKIQKKIVIESREKDEFLHYVEAIDVQSIKTWVEGFFAMHAKLFEESPYSAFEFCFTVVELMIRAFDDLNVAIQDKDVFRKHAEMMFDSCSLLRDLKSKLLDIVEAEISKRLHEKQQNISMYAQQAKNYIDVYYAETITLEVIAEKLHISPVYLSVIFKSETGMNYSKYLASVRIEKSKELLKNCDFNLTQIANAVGYDTTNYFSKLFKRHIGLRPTEYRRLHQNNIGE